MDTQSFSNEEIVYLNRDADAALRLRAKLNAIYEIVRALPDPESILSAIENEAVYQKHLGKLQASVRKVTTKNLNAKLALVLLAAAAVESP